jgi:hypothetical protein
MNIDFTWWIGAVELPALAGLFWLIWKTKREMEAMLAGEREANHEAQGEMREALSAYKLEVAKSYASIGYIKDIERRLTEHLVRIEAKLDGVNGGRA